jgi:hypothetical protein
MGKSIGRLSSEFWKGGREAGAAFLFRPQGTEGRSGGAANPSASRALVEGAPPLEESRIDSHEPTPVLPGLPSN